MIKEEVDGYKVSIKYIESEKEIGFINIESHYEIIDIVDVYVQEEHRNKGVASELLKYLIENYSNKCEKFMLEVRISNKVAIHLYEKYGFKQISVRKNYYDKEDALILERTVK